MKNGIREVQEGATRQAFFTEACGRCIAGAPRQTSLTKACFGCVVPEVQAHFGDDARTLYGAFEES